MDIMVHILLLLLASLISESKQALVSSFLSQSFFNDSYTQIEPSHRTYCSTDDQCRFDQNEICDPLIHKCICSPYYEQNEAGICIECPDQAQRCHICCKGPHLICYIGICVKCHFDISTQKCISQDELFYVTISQIALVTAMFLGMLALLVLLYRTCIKFAYIFGRRARDSEVRTHNIGHMQRLGFTRTSITSIQRRVITRLKDRPPRYARAILENNTNNNGQIVNDQSCVVLGEPPPMYESSNAVDIESHRDLPPDYSIAVISSPYLEAVSRVAVHARFFNNISSNNNVSTINNSNTNTNSNSTDKSNKNNDANNSRTDNNLVEEDNKLDKTEIIPELNNNVGDVDVVGVNR